MTQQWIESDIFLFYFMDLIEKCINMSTILNNIKYSSFLYLVFIPIKGEHKHY